MIVGVTGSRGAIGTSLIEALEESDVTIKRLPRVLNNKWITKDLNIDVLIHLAYPPAPRTRAAIQQHIVNSRHLIDYCSDNGIKIIYASSMSVHSNNFSSYSAMKKSIENYIISNSKKYLIIRFGLYSKSISRFKRIIEFFPSSTFPKQFFLFDDELVKNSLDDFVNKKNQIMYCCYDTPMYLKDIMRLENESVPKLHRTYSHFLNILNVMGIYDSILNLRNGMAIEE